LSLRASHDLLPDPTVFWAQTPRPEQIHGMREKYLALERLSSLAGDDARRRVLRGVARRWPAALREAELVHPDVMRERMVLANDLPITMTRRQWSSRGASPVVLWAELHDLLSDQLDARRRRRERDPARSEAALHAEAGAVEARARALSTEGFVAWLSPTAAARWPDAARLSRLCGEVVRPRQAYLWLAARSGLSLPQLHRRLFDRSGHWDHRPGDPDWAHVDRGPSPGDDDPDRTGID